MLLYTFSLLRIWSENTRPRQGCSETASPEVGEVSRSDGEVRDAPRHGSTRECGRDGCAPAKT